MRSAPTNCEPCESARDRSRETFNVALRSDIWFPYVIGAAHPSRDLEHFFDHRELAHRNTPRLNQLLATIARLVTEAGGRWYLDKDAPLALRAVLGQLAIQGRRRDAEVRCRLRAMTALGREDGQDIALLDVRE